MSMKILNILPILLVLFSCKDQGPQPADMVGKYEITVRLKEGVADKKSIKSEINEALKKVGDEMEDAKKTLEKEVDLSDIDTSTLDGKIEYNAKVFGKSIAEVGLEMGTLSEDFGDSMSGIAESLLDFSESMIKKIRVEIELLANGDFKTQNKLVNLGYNNSKWEVSGDEFIITNNGDTTTKRLKIIKRDSNGFSVEEEKVILDFNKKK